ncbi:hypothetical protein [Nonomuraea dietziae]|uniref:Uncharacterized protein n=1 Tax=Nonomuraea dietziae TaxID=65515 RepID=A0A7W5UVB8_9ACTN|nr:hypothetical protein [Nonomuraea dietziae]MBB3725326.1 hypothetical protein [Nonomuraea dietziae]
MSVERLHHLDYPAYTTGQAAQVLGLEAVSEAVAPDPAEDRPRRS